MDLTNEQKLIINNAVAKNPDISLSELTAMVFKDKTVDSRSKRGRLVKNYLIDNKIQYKDRSVYQRERVELTDEQREFIKNNYKSQNYLDMARILFKKPDLTHLNLESKEVSKFVEHLQKDDPHYLEMYTYDGRDSKKNSNTEYFPPRRSDQTIFRINKYLNLGWEQSALKATQIKQVEVLQRYLNTFSFCYQINTYQRDDDRKLFEDAFIRYTYDKPDLTQEELDQFITLCTEVVTA